MSTSALLWNEGWARGKERLGMLAVLHQSFRQHARMIRWTSELVLMCDSKATQRAIKISCPGVEVKIFPPGVAMNAS